MSHTEEAAPRVITLGDSGVGKTCLIHRMKTGEFLADASPTIGAGVTSLEVATGGRRLTLQIWDTAGQEMYRSIIPIYFKGAVFAILVFSVDDMKSFQGLDSWLEEIAQHSDPDIVVVLVGSKCDTKDRQVDDETAKKYAKDHDLTLFFASSITGQNVSVILEHIAISHGTRRKTGDVSPCGPTPAEKGSKGCC